MLKQRFLLHSTLILTIIFSYIILSSINSPASACLFDGKSKVGCGLENPGGSGGGGSGGGGSDGGSGGGGGGSGSDGGGSDGGGGGSGGAALDCGPEFGNLCYDPGPGGGGGGGGDSRPAPPTRIPESQFKTFNIPAPTIYAWPKDWAVVGKTAAFWTDSNIEYFDITLLGYPVEIKVTPEEYYWDFGDGTGANSVKTGAKPRPGAEPEIGHNYQEPGTKNVSMTTTFSGEFSVAGGPWLAIEGHAAVASNEIGIDVYRYHRYLVDEDCYENPQGPDCPG